MIPLVTLQEIRHCYAEKEVLAGVSLTLQPGESVVLTGPSGAGKSTLVRIASGLLLPHSGSVCIRAARIGFVFQEPRLLPWRTAVENVMRPLCLPKAVANELAHTMLRTMELAEAAHLYPDQLSGGMRQRVSLARALVIKPDLLILDEPFTGLDNSLRKQLKELLERTLCNSDIGIMQVTHHAEDILEGTQSVYKLEKGTLNRISGKHTETASGSQYRE